MLFGKTILEGMAVVSGLKIADRKAFMAGNIIPDFALEKDAAHFYAPDDDALYYPDLTWAKAELAEVKDDSLRLGLLGHYYLDARVTREFLAARFDYDPEVGVVCKKDTGHEWSLKEFFSPRGLYHGYGECNGLLVRDGMISLDWAENHVPKNLPDTGLELLDARKSENWLDELAWMLEDPPIYTGAILVYGEFVDFVQKSAADFLLSRP